MSRFGTLMCAGLGLLGSSFAPTWTPSARPVVSAERPRATAALAPLAEAPNAPPKDVVARVEAVRGGLRLSVRRRGHIVALMRGDVRAASDDVAVVEIAVVDLSGAEGARGRTTLVWETTNRETLETDRGLVSIETQGQAFATRLGAATPPLAVETIEGPHHICRAHEDGAGGFAVVCRLDASAHRVFAVDVTGAQPLAGATLDAGRHVVRLDLPLDAQLAPETVAPRAESRIVSFTSGGRVTILTADATWVPGEAPALALASMDRIQP